MTIEEFLNQLKECLEDQVSQEEINDALTYYRGYYYEQLNLGKSTEEIFDSLGSPRLIAHSIIDAQEEASSKSTSGYYDVDDETYDGDEQVPVEQKVKALAVRGGIIVGLVLAVIAAGALLHFLLPVILVLLVVYGISRLLK